MILISSYHLIFALTHLANGSVFLGCCQVEVHLLIYSCLEQFRHSTHVLMDRTRSSSTIIYKTYIINRLHTTQHYKHQSGQQRSHAILDNTGRWFYLFFHYLQTSKFFNLPSIKNATLFISKYFESSNILELPTTCVVLSNKFL